MEQAEAPDNARCPSCGAAPSKEQADRAIVHERLTNTGYLHGDFTFDCPECGEEYTHGVPVGDFEGGDDLRCEPCGTWVMVHRVKVRGKCETTDGDEFEAPADGILLHTKCPSCYRFEKIKREGDRNGVALIGYPPITGKIDDETRSYGWQSEPP